MEAHYTGRPVPRKEGREKVTGRARYVGDITLPDMLFGATVPNPPGRIERGAYLTLG